MRIAGKIGTTHTPPKPPQHVVGSKTTHGIMSSTRSTRSRRRAQEEEQEEEEEAKNNNADTIPEEIREEEMQEEDNADNDQMEEDEDGNESSSLGSINDLEMDEDVNASPSPDKKKDMQLRSGKRKRRRSRETTGLTPPEDASARKKARRGAVRSAKKAKQPEKEEEAIEEETKQEQEETTTQDAPSRKARDSILQTDNTALAAANQEPENTPTGDAVEADEGRRLFDSQPPAMPATVTETSESSRKPVNGSSLPTVAETAEQVEASKTAEAPPPEELEAPPPKLQSNKWMKQIFLIYMVLIVVTFRIWIPLAGKLALAIVPLNEEALYIDPPILEEEVVVDEDAASSSALPVPSEILHGLAELQKHQNNLGGSSQNLDAFKAELLNMIKMLRTNANVTKRKMMVRFGRLMEAENVLQTILKEKNNSQAWKNAQDTIDALRLPNRKLLADTTVLDLWQVEDPVQCPEDGEVENGSTVVEVVEDKDPPISPRIFETTETNLLLRATMTAEKIVRSEKAEANVRAWVREKIDTAIEDDDETLAALEQIRQMSLDDEASNTLSLEMIGALLQERLELEMADGTGAFDHAALMSGAKIVYGGKRGTSKSITDSLPLYNRLMQLSGLRFYGHGPEAAITPTYPKNTLGQCWSFQPLPVKEQLKLDHTDDHKHGSFGTLTISLAKPVKIESISIEHPAVTDHPKSAIRGFRIIGFEDALAQGKGHPMGSFQYRMGGPSIQEFPVADKAPMQSVSLAIDSNWGLEYACLYRFRVHGVGVAEV